MKTLAAKMMTGLLCLSVGISNLSLSAGNGWKPVGGHIMTPWAASVQPESVLPDYPRPQLVRPAWTNLNGLWKYAITDASATEFTPEGDILVPFPLESALSGVGRRLSPDQALWYERVFTLKPGKGRTLLHFGAVDWAAEVYVNGYRAGRHTGGYTPFTFDVTDYLNAGGRQVLTVRVTDACDQTWQPRGKQVSSPQGLWYTPVSGIWQTVWVEQVPDSYVGNYCADLQGDTLGVDVTMPRARRGDELRVELLDGALGYNPEKPSGKVLAQTSVPVSSETCHLEFPAGSLRRWSVDDPYLYGLKLTLLRGGKILDVVQGYAALRSVSILTDLTPFRSRRIAINGEPVFQFGPLDQGWWPDGLYTAPTDEALRFDIEKTKEMGFNLIRKHIKVEPARWYWWCDVLGMLVWQDMPNIGDHHATVAASRPSAVAEAQHNNWSRDSFICGTDCIVPQEWKDNYYKEWGEIIDACKGFACIVTWVPFNEAWGQFDTEAAVEFTRRKDASRLVDAASGGNLKPVGDIVDGHHYPHPVMNAFENKMVNVVGEYGGIGLPVPGHLWQEDRNWGYVKYKDGAEVLSVYAEYAQLLKDLIDHGCAAAVYTQTTDVEGETNGLITYDRAVVKVDIDALRAINHSVIEHQETLLRNTVANPHFQRDKKIIPKH